MVLLKTVGLFAVCICFVTLGVSTDVKEENDVLVLDRSNFQNVVNEKDVLLVEFYAPWCGHCKSLEPHYAAAAKQLKPKGVSLAKVDATVESGLAGDYGVEGYPTLKIFKRGLNGGPFDYEGPRDTEGIVKHMETVAKPDWKPPFKLAGLHRLTKENLTEMLDKQEAWLIAFVDAGADGALAPASEAADLLKRGRDSKAVGYLDSSDTELAEQLGIGQLKPPAYAVVRKGEKSPPIFKHELSGINLEKFYRAHAAEVAPTGHEFNSLREMEEINDGLETLLIGYFDESASAIEKFLRNFLLESGYFYNRRLEGGKIINSKLAKQLQLKSNTIYLRLPTKLMSKGETQLIQYTGELSGRQLKSFFDSNSLPLVGHYSWSTKDAYNKAKLPVCLFLLTVSFRGEQLASTRAWHTKFAKLAKPYSGRALFAMADDEAEEELVKSFKLDDSSADFNIGCYDGEKRRYAMPEADSYDEDEAKQFIDSVLAGKAKPVIRSATAKVNAAIELPAIELTGNTFADLIFKDGSRHSVVFMCSLANQPCAHSLKEFTEAASSPSLTGLPIQFAKMNTKYNDAPGNYYYRFDPEDVDMTRPQIYLGIIGNKENPIVYDKDVVAKDYVIQFIKDHASKVKTEL